MFLHAWKHACVCVCEQHDNFANNGMFENITLLIDVESHNQKPVWQYYNRLMTPSEILYLSSPLNGALQPVGCGKKHLYQSRSSSCLQLTI